MTNTLKTIVTAAVLGFGIIGTAQAADLGGDRNTFGRDFGNAFATGGVAASVRPGDTGNDRNTAPLADHSIVVKPVQQGNQAAPVTLSVQGVRGVTSG